MKNALAKREESVGVVQSLTVEDLIARAIEKGDINTIERLFDLRQKVKAEKAQEAFDSALSAFQAECPVIPKKRTVREKPEKGGKVRYHFAAKEDMDKIIRPILGKYGLSYTTKTFVDWEQQPPRMKSICIARHVAGHREETPFEAPVDLDAYMTSQQKFASAASFCERYAAKHGLGLTFAGEDDDGQSAGGISPKDARKIVTQPQQRPSVQKKPDERPQIEPAAEGIPTLDEKTIKGLKAAMAHATLGGKEFLARFPKLERMDQIADTPENRKIVLSWIANPSEN